MTSSRESCAPVRHAVRRVGAQASRSLMACALLVCALAVACGGTRYSRGSENPEIDNPAMSTGLDRVDLELALDTWMASFGTSGFVTDLGLDRPTVSILKIANNTSEHIGGALQNLLNSVETRLVQSGDWRVVDNSELMADAAMAERIRQLGDEVDPATRVALGQQFGIRYLIHGRVGDVAEKTGGVRRVQYFLFLRVSDVQSNEIVFQEQVDITKQVEG